MARGAVVAVAREQLGEAEDHVAKGHRPRARSRAAPTSAARQHRPSAVATRRVAERSRTTRSRHASQLPAQIVALATLHHPSRALTQPRCRRAARRSRGARCASETPPGSSAPCNSRPSVSASRIDASAFSGIATSSPLTYTLFAPMSAPARACAGLPRRAGRCTSSSVSSSDHRSARTCTRACVLPTREHRLREASHALHARGVAPGDRAPAPCRVRQRRLPAAQAGGPASARSTRRTPPCSRPPRRTPHRR